MSGSKEERIVWNKLAHVYEERFMKLSIYDETYCFFKDQLLHANATILEVGCGPGNISAALLKINPQLRILATDYASNMVELAQKNNPQIEVQVLDAKDILILNRQFDGIVAGFIAPYLSSEDLIGFFQDVHLQLNGKGVFYFSFVAGEPSQSIFQTGSTGDQLFFNFHSLREVTTSLENLGFNILQSFVLSYEKANGDLDEHTIIISRKR